MTDPKPLTAEEIAGAISVLRVSVANERVTPGLNAAMRTAQKGLERLALAERQLADADRAKAEVARLREQREELRRIWREGTVAEMTEALAEPKKEPAP